MDYKRWLRVKGFILSQTMAEPILRVLRGTPFCHHPGFWVYSVSVMGNSLDRTPDPIFTVQARMAGGAA